MLFSSRYRNSKESAIVNIVCLGQSVWDSEFYSLIKFKLICNYISIDSIIEEAKYFKEITIKSINDIDRRADHLLFNMKYYDPMPTWTGVPLSRNFIYNFRLHRFCVTDNFTGDKSTGYLPISDRGIVSINELSFAYLNQYYYSFVSSLKYLQHMRLPKISIRNNLQEYFKTKSRKSNPVFVDFNL